MRPTPVDPLPSALLEPMTGKRCLVTGASGFLGQNLVATLLAARAQVHATVHRAPVTQNPQILNHGCDLTRLAEVEKVFAAVKPDYVFHLATARADETSGRDSLLGNILSAENLIRACLQFKPQRLIVAGSSLEYGIHTSPLHEDMMLEPNSLFGATKAATTLLFKQASLKHKLPVTVLRIFSIYGYGEPEHRLIPTAMHAALEQTELPLTATGPRRDFVFVTDVVEALLLAASADKVAGEIFNVGTGIQTRNEDVVNMIQAVSGKPIRINAGAYEPRATDTAFWCADTHKTEQMLRWAARHRLEQGLQKTWDWFCQTQAIV